VAKAPAVKRPARRPLAKKLIDLHRVDGGDEIGAPLALRIDQTLTQDATGTLAMLSLEAMHLDRVKTEVSVQYVDHNLLEVDILYAEDHIFLESACRRFGLWYSRPGNGISHVVRLCHVVERQTRMFVGDNGAHATAVTDRHVSIAEARKARCVLAEIRWR
jgi:homoaconitase/3-isopropylmalate dehydratase large subunit